MYERPVSRARRVSARALKILTAVFALLLLCHVEARSVTTAEIKLTCKNKCQYLQQKDCYESCIREGITGGPAGRANLSVREKFSVIVPRP